MPEYRATTKPRPAEHKAPPLEFPGCRPVRISRSEIADYERRIEYRDAATEEIHRALNEPELSEATLAALRRVGRARGAAEGTGPDDDPLLRAERTETRIETRREAVLHVLKSRRLPVSAALSQRLSEQQDVATAALIQAALQCRDETDFLRLIGGKHH